MPKKLNLTLACGDYDIVRPLLKGNVEVDGVDLTILTDMDSATRHWRFLNGGEFDVAELSSSSYLAARDNDLPFRAIPVFLHRRFRHGFMFINTSKGISKPADLKGRRIGVKTMMTTAVLWMRGILQSEYGVPLNSIEWVAEIEDDIKVTLPSDIRYSCLPNDKSVETMLAEGELDAVFPFRFDQAVCCRRSARGAPLPRPQGGRDGLLQAQRDFPDHACPRHPECIGGRKSVARGEPVQGFQRGKGGRHEAHGEPAHRPARLVSRRLGGAGAHSWPRSVGIRT